MPEMPSVLLSFLTCPIFFANMASRINEMDWVLHTKKPLILALTITIEGGCEQLS